MDVSVALLFLIFATALSQNNESPCEKSWTYHEHTVTCMKLFLSRESYTTAKNLCSSYMGGPSRDKKGWLVGVHDDLTNSFVHNLIEENQIEKAFIGLSKINDQWKWDGNLKNANNGFLKWKSGSPVSPGWFSFDSYDDVTITKEGWETVKNDAKHSFVCQVFPFLPAASIICPPSEEGKPLLPVKCIIPFQKSYGSLQRIYINYEKRSPFVTCTTTGCTSFNLKELVTAQISEVNESWITEVEVKNVTLRSNDNDQWSCSAEFMKTTIPFLSASCTWHTFVRPKAVYCTYIFSVDVGVIVECRVEGVFPRAESIWMHFINGKEVGHLQPHEESNKSHLYRSVFTGEISASGLHTLRIIVFPYVEFSDAAARQDASLTREVEFTIFAPPQPPIVFTQNGISIFQNFLTVKEGTTIIVVCEVTGGMPSVKQTMMQCDGDQVKDSYGKTSWENEGINVSFTLDITKAIDQTMCSCKAQHVTGSYNKSTSFTLNILHAAEIVSFKVNNKETSQEIIDVDVNTEVSFLCMTGGNPTPQKSFYKQIGDEKTKLVIEENTKSFIKYTLTKASCDSSGTYLCAVENSFSSEPVERGVKLRVKCPPQPCSNKVGDREFSIEPGKAFNFQTCIFAYPKPHTDIRISIKDKHNLNTDTYNAKYTTTNDLETEGYVAIHMFSTVTELGNYTIDFYVSSQLYKIDFKLVRDQAPSCPRFLNISSVGSNFVFLKWQSAFDRGIPQTFTLTRINYANGVEDKENVKDDKIKEIIHNSTGLYPNTQYRFQLSVRNEVNSTECPQLTVNVTTQAPPNSQQSSGDSTAAVISTIVIVFLLLVIIAIIAAVLMRRKKQKLTENKSSLVSSPDQGQHSDIRKTKEFNDSHNIGDLYAIVNKPKKTAVLKPDNVYNNEVVMEMRSDLKESEQSETNQVDSTMDSFVYANSGGFCSPDIAPHNKVSSGDINSKKDKDKASKQRKAKVKKQSSKAKDQSADNLPHLEQRSNELHNKELVYVEVQITPGQERVQVQPDVNPEPVDYASLSFHSDP